MARPVPLGYQPCPNCGHSREYPHGTTGYKYGCRCEVCKGAAAASANYYREKRYKERNSTPKWRHSDRELPCGDEALNLPTGMQK